MLIPTVHLFWKRYQTSPLTRLKDMGGITLSGDGRHDSMGHCAKYCAYTIFCCTLPGIIHFALVQVCYFHYHMTIMFYGTHGSIDMYQPEC